MARICSIPGCGEKHKAHGYCRLHYQKFRRSGDPEAYSQRGAATAFLESTVLTFTGDDCLIWPFYRNGWGYGVYRHDGRPVGVHRLVCEVVHGAAPGDEYQAAHSCGRGRDGCVNPSHIRWATPQENSDDKAAHGTMARGSRIAQAKLDEPTVIEVFALKGVLSGCEIARRFGVAESTVRQIHSQQTWAWLTGAQQ